MAAARDFYRAIAPAAGFDLRRDTPERVRFAAATGSFSLVAGGTPPERPHMTLAGGEVTRSERLRDPDGNTVDVAPG